MLFTSLQDALGMKESQTSLSEQVKKLEEVVDAGKKKTLEAKDEALQLSKSLAEMQPHVVENNMRKEEIDRLTKQTKQLESQLKTTEQQTQLQQGKTYFTFFY